MLDQEEASEIELRDLFNSKNAEVLLRVAEILLDSHDDHMAIFFYELAARRGSSEAQRIMGLDALEKEDVDIALNWYEMAAQNNNKLALAELSSMREEFFMSMEEANDEDISHYLRVSTFLQNIKNVHTTPKQPPPFHRVIEEYDYH